VAPLEVAAFGRDLELVAPRSAEDLLNEEDFERDERLPYWADLWPSSYALADRVASDNSAEGDEPTRLLELGCGLGLVTIAALSAGFDVLARTMAPTGEALIADPGRTALPAFLRECEARGLVVASVESWRYAEAAVRQTIVVHQIIRRANSR
jgi:hypothetical protein